MREMEWPPARGGAGLLIDRPRLAARAALDGLGQTLISGDLDAAVARARARRADPRPLRARARGRACACASAATSALLVTPAPLAAADGWRDGWCATGVDDGWAAVEVSGADAPQALMQATSADLAVGLALGRRARLWPARPPRADARRLPRSMSRRRGWRRCSPGSTASSRKPNRVAALDRFPAAAIPERRRRSNGGVVVLGCSTPEG